MSGGVDSAATAALFKKAGYRVIGITMPINQNPEETERGIEACHALGIEHIHADLSNLYNSAIEELALIDSDIRLNDKATRIRKGNIRARLRMITLYNFAAKFGGFVASTDNFSELTAGFWTLHGDVGDLAPIQSLLKSWEVPVLAKLVGVPESTWRATPTDGLGIDAGDEAQLGTTYLEWDLLLLTYMYGANDTHPNELCKPEIQEEILAEMRTDMTEVESKKLDAFISRFSNTSFKRTNPLNLEFPALPNRNIMRIGHLPDIDEAFAKMRGFSVNAR